jgi:lipoprotein-anchoring transpeptidase ErfK/SrfK
MLPGSPRVYARRLRIWIRERPDSRSPRLGYLRLGSSAPTRGEPVRGSGCARGWYPIEPRGFVCVGSGATLDGADPVVHASREYPPDPSRKLPYIYGTVRRPGPIYQRLPSSDELRRAEPDIDDRMPAWLDAGGEIGASYAQDVWLGGSGEPPDPRADWEQKRTAGVPWFLADGANAPNPLRKSRGKDLVIDRMGPRVGYSFLQTFLWEGRRYGVTTDLRVMPTDRLRPIQGSEHHGVTIGRERDIDFPFALIRKKDAKFWLYEKSKNRLVDAGTAPYFAAVKLTGKQKFFRNKLHYETADGKYVSDREAARIEPAKRMPKWGKNGEKWIDVNLTQQRLVLYEGTKPVFATLISSGEAGLEDPKHTTATKRGIFRIHTKHVTATMDSDEIGEEFELRDVPYVQYFDKEGYALHGAYWHDRFGTPKSHGCINLTPEDARRIFFWTEPQLPIGWHGVLLPLKGTVMFIHP